ncbi:hypothetical protein [Flavobacterium selenitireducens]|uniref:hypothetical protein n=1 Tax=Flavobacterium selenitireducens TaxID=2722704 RepID=UPI00168B378F|nr:hypothetical protein [Flavobacterium selenitireducens]MBD3582965.1 hypothetical protein [Flavobacterium selenitireducens]
MKNLLLIWLALVGCPLLAQDMKEASSDKTAVLEGRLRDAKPTIETGLPDGTKISIWTISSVKADGSPGKHIAKACAKNEIPQTGEGIRTIATDFHYANGVVSGVQYNETLVIQNPTPSVSTKKKEFIFTDGIQTSPIPGSSPELEKLVKDCLAQIDKAFDNHVHTQ